MLIAPPRHDDKDTRPRSTPTKATTMGFFGASTTTSNNSRVQSQASDDHTSVTSHDDEAEESTTYYEESDEEDDDDDDDFDDNDTYTQASSDSMSCDASLVPRPRRYKQQRTLLQQQQQRRVVDLAATSSEDVTYYTSSYYEGEEEDEEEEEEEDEIITRPRHQENNTEEDEGRIPAVPSQSPKHSASAQPSSPIMAESSNSFVSRVSVESSQSSGLLAPPPVVVGSSKVANRVPGGAAAKIMLIGPRGSLSDSTGGGLHQCSSESTYRHNQHDVLTGVENDLLRAREEFTTGAPHPTEFMSTNNHAVDLSLGDDSVTPSFLNRSEVFHQNASAAVAALLSPDPSAPTEQGVFASFPSSPAHYEAKPVVSPHLIDKTTEQKVENLESKMLDPTATLTGLLKAIASHTTPPTDPLAYAVRRKNACGALQTLTANPNNRSRICWTVGVLPALTSVLQDGLADADNSHNDNPRIRTEYQAAQTRAISALMNLSMPVKNRIAVFHSPGLVRAALTTIDQQVGQARHGCTAILAFLAKSPENRLLLAQVPGMLDVVCKVLQPRAATNGGQQQQLQKQDKKVYPWSDEHSTSSSNMSESKKGGDEELDDDDDDTSPPSLTMSDDVDDSTPKQEGAADRSALTGYDDTADTLLRGARQNCFAMLGHLVKEKDNAYHFARDLHFLTTLVDISHYQLSPSHTLAIKILAHLTRHRLNKVLAFKPKSVVPAFVAATQSECDETRLYACYALQNLSQEKSCRQELAISNHLIEALCERCRVATVWEERLATISTLKNLCDEPANLIPMTNTADCVSTLMQLADGGDATGNSSMIQYRACDALATLSHWLRKIATSGYSLDATEQGRPPMKGLFVPTLREVSWNQWT